MIAFIAFIEQGFNSSHFDRNWYSSTACRNIAVKKIQVSYIQQSY